MPDRPADRRKDERAAALQTGPGQPWRQHRPIKPKKKPDYDLAAGICTTDDDFPTNNWKTSEKRTRIALAWRPAHDAFRPAYSRVRDKRAPARSGPCAPPRPPQTL